MILWILMGKCCRSTCHSFNFVNMRFVVKGTFFPTTFYGKIYFMEILLHNFVISSFTLTYVPLDKSIPFNRKQCSPLFCETGKSQFSALYFLSVYALKTRSIIIHRRNVKVIQHIDWSLIYVWEVWLGKIFDIYFKHIYQSNNTCMVTLVLIFIYILIVTRLFKYLYQGRSEGTSSVAFEVLIINCQTCFKDLFSFTCLISNFSFPKRYIICRQKRKAVMDACPWFRLLNSTGKMMTCLRHNEIKFWGSAPCAQIY